MFNLIPIIFIGLLILAFVTSFLKSWVVWLAIGLWVAWWLAREIFAWGEAEGKW